MTTAPPTNSLCRPLLTDLYQLSMTYAYWKNGSHDDPAVFDLFFRTCPFKGAFTVFCGLEECVRFLAAFRFTDDDIAYLRTVMRGVREDAFFEWLRHVDCSQLTVHAQPEGSVAFPRTPLLRVEGPIAVAQLIETPLLNLVNYASLVATNAARHVLAAGSGRSVVEFGLRRAQGPDGAVSASKYSYVGGCTGTSNVLAGQLFGIPVQGTIAHSFVTSFEDDTQLRATTIPRADGSGSVDLLEAVLALQQRWGWTSTNRSELLAFVSYAVARPDAFLALVDTYDTVHSGVPNFLLVAYALHEADYRALGVRLDSGDLAELSKQTRALFRKAGEEHGVEHFAGMTIVASDGINERKLLELNTRGHEINVYGIGTNLVTCQAQPALGCVYKLVEVRGHARIKLSETIAKVTIPGRKSLYRLYADDGSGTRRPHCDFMVRCAAPGDGEEQPAKKRRKSEASAASAPAVGAPLQCADPFKRDQSFTMTPVHVEPLLSVVWCDGKRQQAEVPLSEVRERCLRAVAELGEQHTRLKDPEPYHVAVSSELQTFLHEQWESVTAAIRGAAK